MSALVIHSIDSRKNKFVLCKISIFYLVSGAEQTGLSAVLTCLKPLRQGFFARRYIPDMP